MIWVFFNIYFQIVSFSGTHNNVKTRLLKPKLRIQLKLWDLKHQLKFLEAFPKPEEKHFQFSISQKRTKF